MNKLGHKNIFIELTNGKMEGKCPFGLRNTLKRSDINFSDGLFRFLLIATFTGSKLVRLSNRLLSFEY